MHRMGLWTILCPLLWIIFGLPVSVRAAGGPENILLVVNADNSDSVAVAQEYIRLRHIHPINVVSLRALPTGVVITIEDFREHILRPILTEIQRRGLTGQIDYVVYSAGFPYAVDVSADIVGRTFPTFITQPASLTGLTYLYELVLEKNPDYLNLDSNRYARRPRSPEHDAPWTDAEKRRRAELDKLFAKCAEARQRAEAAKTPIAPEIRQMLDDAAAISRELTSKHGHNPELLYNLACALALQQKPEESMTSLTAAFRAGWWNADLTEADTDLTSLREQDDFKALVKQMRDTIVVMQSARPFHHAISWSETGDPAPPKSGRHYLLSAMLAYTGGSANTLDEALACLRTSATADGSRPQGTVYFMASDDVARTGPRRWAFRSAVDALAKLGVHAEVVSGVLPKEKPDVAGAMVGAATFSWNDSGSRILPGAFCDHLTSFGGLMTGGGQTLLSEFLRSGAAGACGTVTEPYNVQGKFPTAFVHVFYASGCSLAEAFYQSVSGPYQQLLVGDPLCRPWAKIPIVHVQGLSAHEIVRQPRRLKPWATAVATPTRFDLYVDGRRRQTCASGKSFLLDPTGLSEGEHEVRVVAVVGIVETDGRIILPFRVANRGH